MQIFIYLASKSISLRVRILFFAAALLLSVVSDAQKVVLDRLVFGTYYGMCRSDCINIYAVESNQLFKDDSATYGKLDWFFYFTPTRKMDAAKHKLAKGLLNQVPMELLSKNRTTIGCPDCADQGGIYIQAMSGPVSATLKLDIDDTEEQSAEVIAFKRKLLEVVGYLKQ